MKSPHIKFKTVIRVTSFILSLVFVHNAIAANQIDEATEQRIIREQNRVILNQQIFIEADQRKREADIIDKQTPSIVNKGVGRIDENQNLFPDPKKN
jgi:hypothetical protein